MSRELTEEQQKVFDAVISSQSPFIFIQGKAGTGKSFLVKAIQHHLGCKILVPTNMAKSVYSHDAQVIHSFFYGELDDLENEYQNPFNYSQPRNGGRLVTTLRNVTHFILDEISMVRVDLFEMMNKICQVAKRNNAPFGGIQIIIVGDMLQLPPVVQEPPEGEENAIKKYLLDTYGGIYFFNSTVIQENLAKIEFYELKESQRQKKDPSYEKLLDTLREPQTNENNLRDALEKINQRVVTAHDIPEPKDVTTIVTTNNEVERINAEQLHSLPGEEQTALAHFRIYKKSNPKEYTEFEGSPEPSKYNQQDYYPLDIPSKFTPVLKYKIGSKVMFTQNYKQQGVYNGDFGIIKEIRPDSLLIEPVKEDRIVNIIEIKKKVVNRREIKYDEKTKKLKVGNIIQITEQYPLKSGYAFTVHKSQGQSYDKVVLDLDNGVMFASGQSYVALSRSESLSGLYLTKRLTISDCRVDPQLIGFLNQMRMNQHLVEKEKYPVIPAEMLLERALDESCQRFKDIVCQSKLAQSTKDDISALVQYYNNSYVIGQYRFAMSELDRILYQIEPVCTDVNVLRQIRQDVLKNVDVTKESCDNILDRIGNLCQFMVPEKSTELLPVDHRTVIAQQDIPWEHKILFSEETFERAETYGFTYEKLFAQYLKGFKEITLKEPYLEHDYQFENLQEFIDLLVKIKDPNVMPRLELITLRLKWNRNEKQDCLSPDECKRNLNVIEKRYSEKITCLVTAKEKMELHDREIIADTGWKIKLGRGLHIWIEPRYDVRQKNQSDRPCYGGFSIIYYKPKANA